MHIYLDSVCTIDNRDFKRSMGFEVLAHFYLLIMGAGTSYHIITQNTKII